VETVEEITANEFFSRFYAAGVPLLIRGFFRHCPAVLEWSPARLAERFGDAVVDVMTNLRKHPNYAGERNRYARKMTMRELVEAIKRDPEGGDLYLAAQSRAFERLSLGQLANEVNLDPLMFDGKHQRERTSLWLGPGNTVTPLHYDQMNVILAQVWGSKRVLLIAPSETGSLYNRRGGYSDVDPESPDFERFPLFQNVAVSVMMLEPGSALFLPRGWWHQVRSLTPSISLSISNFVWPNG
jgi:hypothetical protein